MTTIGQNHLGKIAWLVLAASVFTSVLLLFFTLGIRLEEGGVSGGKPVQVQWPENVDLSGLDWSVVQDANPGGSGAVNSLSSRYRLAGTFIPFDVPDERRKAIIDDLKSGVQKIVSEGQKINDIIVVRISTDRVVVRSGSAEEVLRLSFMNTVAKAEQKEPGKGAGDKGKFKPLAGKFGTQIGERNWLLNREKLLGYYNELMSEPKRLVSVFDSLKPIYNEKRRIEGYHLDVVGEPDFFKAVGWKQGDVVRSVNSMKMSNRHRAEFFIRQFVADKANAFMIDMERNGEPMKMVYRVRSEESSE